MGTFLVNILLSFTDVEEEKLGVTNYIYTFICIIIYILYIMCITE